LPVVLQNPIFTDIGLMVFFILYVI